MINAAMNPNLKFDFIKDFAPITLLTSTPTVLVVTPELGVKERQGADRARQGKSPTRLSFGSSGVGSSTHLALELFKSLAGVKIRTCPTPAARRSSPTCSPAASTAISRRPRR